MKLKAKTRGALDFGVVMTPGFREEYRYDDEIDQSYLPEAIEQLKHILQMYNRGTA